MKILEASTGEDKKLKRIFLSDNKLVCDARLAEFKEYFGDDRITNRPAYQKVHDVVEPSDLICYYPPEYAEKSLDELNYAALPALGNTAA